MSRFMWRWLTIAFGFTAALWILPAYASQDTPPIRGTIALEGDVDKTYKAANTLMVKTADGVRHLFHITGRTAVHGADAAGDALADLEAGTKVVVHYTTADGERTAVEVDRLADGGLKTMEGVVSGVDRERRTITIRLGDGTKETLRLTERASVDVGKDVDRAADTSAKVVVYYTNESGLRVVHYFRRVS